MVEDDGASTDVNVRIQKATGSFSKLRKVWLSTSIRKDTKNNPLAPELFFLNFSTPCM